MNKNFYLIFCLIIFSCNNSIKTEHSELKNIQNKFKKIEHEFIYEFEKVDEITNIDIDTNSCFKKAIR